MSFSPGISGARISPSKVTSGFSLFLVCHVCEADYLALDTLKLLAGLEGVCEQGDKTNCIFIFWLSSWVEL